MKKSFFLVLLLVMATVAMAQPMGDTTAQVQTYAYAQRDTLSLFLDVYQPQNPRSDHACVLYVFGGGFVMGERNNEYSTRYCRLLAERGFVVVAIDYRLYLRHAPKVPLLQFHRLFDTAIRYATEDCSEAIAFLCAHADELHIDPQRIVLTGSSAGAITVLQTDYCRCNSRPETATLPQGFRPAAVIPYAGGVYCSNKAFRYAQPPAPTCLFHGVCDRIVHYNRFSGSLHTTLFGGSSVAKRFEKEGYSYWIFRYEGIGHEVASSLHLTLDEFCAFVDASLSGRIMQYDATCNDAAIRPTKWTHMNLFQLYLR